MTISSDVVHTHGKDMQITDECDPLVLAQDDLRAAPPKLNGDNLKPIGIRLVDFGLLTQECLARAFGDVHPNISISGMTANECIAHTRNDVDLIIYCLRAISNLGVVQQAISVISRALPTVPLIVFCDAEPAQHPQIMRAAIKSGARGYVPMQTADLPLTVAAIHLVNAGGSFVPADLLLTTQSDGIRAPKTLLTARQSSVLVHLQQGKANKTIAYDLGMSESTVKVHVRNIMRKLGATNRTQAAYKASMH